MKIQALKTWDLECFTLLEKLFPWDKTIDLRKQRQSTKIVKN